MSDRLGRFAAIASYFVFAMLVVGMPLFQENVVSAVGVDLHGTIWMHWWVGQSTQSGEFPIWSNLLFYPEGKNFFNDTGANFVDAWLSIPFQWIFGVPDYIDWFEVAVLAGNALCFERLARGLTGGNRVASWAGAVAFELNPYVVAQVALGRPTQALCWFGLLATYHMLRLESGTRRDAVLFGVFMVLQGLTYWFMIYFLVIGLLPIVLYMLWRSPRVVAPRLALAMGVCLLLASPFLWRINAEAAAGRVPRLNLEDWRDTSAGEGRHWEAVQIWLRRGVWMTMLASCLAGIRRTWPWLLGLVLTLVMSTGALFETSLYSIESPLYIAFWKWVPFFERLGFPERIASVSFLLLCVATTLQLARSQAIWGFFLAIGAFGELYMWREIPFKLTKYTFEGPADLIAKHGGAVIGLPFGSNDEMMVYQTHHHQPLFGGMGERAKDLRTAAFQARLDNTFILMLGATMNDNGPPIGYRLADRQAIEKDFRWIWFDNARFPPSWRELDYEPTGKILRMVEELGPPVYVDGHQVLWDLKNTKADPPGLGEGLIMAGAAEEELIEEKITSAGAFEVPTQ